MFNTTTTGSGMLVGPWVQWESYSSLERITICAPPGPRDQMFESQFYVAQDRDQWRAFLNTSGVIEGDEGDSVLKGFIV